MKGLSAAQTPVVIGVNVRPRRLLQVTGVRGLNPMVEVGTVGLVLVLEVRVVHERRVRLRMRIISSG
jgi:hypothetical protein